MADVVLDGLKHVFVDVLSKRILPALPIGMHELSVGSIRWDDYTFGTAEVEAGYTFGYRGFSSLHGTELEETNKPSSCYNPLQTAVSLFSAKENNYIRRLRVIVRHEYKNHPEELGGKNCIPPQRAWKASVIAETPNYILNKTRLLDGSFLVWVGEPRVDLIRISSDFRSEYRSPRVLIFDEDQWVRLPIADGVAAMQKELLSRFTADH